MKIKATRTTDGFTATLEFAWPISSSDSNYITRFAECFGGSTKNWDIVDRMVDAGVEEKVIGLIGLGNFRKLKKLEITVIDKNKYNEIIKKWESDIENNGKDYDSIVLATITEILNDFTDLIK